MKQVDNTQILNSPKTTATCPTEECPLCGEASWAFEDGSIHCLGHGSIEPEPKDTRLFAVRLQFDARHGITPQQRQMAAAACA